MNDATQEALAMVQAGQPEGIALFRDEVSGLFGSFDKYGGTGGDRAYWLEAYNGNPYTIDWVKNDGVPISIAHNTISLIGGIQPERLNERLTADANDGLMSRILFVWPNSILPEIPTKFKDDEKALRAFKKLYELEMAQDLAGNLDFQIVPLEENAVIPFADWRKTNAEEAPPGKLGNFYGKLPSLFLRLSLVLEYLTWSVEQGTPEPTKISKLAVSAAGTLVDDYFKPMAVSSSLLVFSNSAMIFSRGLKEGPFSVSCLIAAVSLAPNGTEVCRCRWIFSEIRACSSIKWIRASSSDVPYLISSSTNSVGTPRIAFPIALIFSIRARSFSIASR